MTKKVTLKKNLLRTSSSSMNKMKMVSPHTFLSFASSKLWPLHSNNQTCHTWKWGQGCWKLYEEHQELHWYYRQTNATPPQNVISFPPKEKANVNSITVLPITYVIMHNARPNQVLCILRIAQLLLSYVAVIHINMHMETINAWRKIRRSIRCIFLVHF